jgi:hypothetical protein
MRCLATGPAILAASLGNPRKMPELRRVTGRSARASRTSSGASARLPPPPAGERAHPRCKGRRAGPHGGPGVPSHEDGYLQLELRRYVRRDGSARARGPYWYFPAAG